MEYECDGDISCSWRTWNSTQKLRKRTGRVRNQRTNQGHSDYRFVRVGQNTKKSPRDLRKFYSHKDSSQISAKAGVKTSQGALILIISCNLHLRIDIKKRGCINCQHQKENMYLSCSTHTHTHTIYIYMCVCVCGLCACMCDIYYIYDICWVSMCEGKLWSPVCYKGHVLICKIGGF